MTHDNKVQFLKREGQYDLAYVHVPAHGEGVKLPLVVFCGGYRSDMSGTKAIYLQEQCAARGQAYLRFDYGGHGQSGGEFKDGTIGSWFSDALDVFDHVVGEGQPVIVVGSSMGGWMALLLAKMRAGTVRGVVGVAAAPDFSEDLFARLSPAQQKEMMSTGHVDVPNDYSDEPYHYTRVFYEEAKTHLLLGTAQHNDFPIRLVQGMKDADVPWQLTAQIQKAYKGAPVDIVLIEDGDHRLSRPEDLEIIDREVVALSEGVH